MKILISLPAYNEARLLEPNVSSLVFFVRENLSEAEIKIIITDNNSKDDTASISQELLKKFPEVDYIFVPVQGKGNAISACWQKWQDQFDVYIFMDADLATDITALPNLVAGINEGFDLVIGSRYLPESQVEKSLGRRFFSFGYHLVLKGLLNTKIHDMPCGFKAVTQKVVNVIVPKIKNHSWFFDSELVYLAEKAGYKIKEIPVKWAEPRVGDDKSRVSVLKVSWQYLCEAWRLRWQK
jgi:glycosyltransferase AglD